MKSFWQIADVDENVVNAFTRNHAISDIVARMLYLRGVTTEQALHQYFSNNFENMSSPFLIDGMKQAAHLLFEAIENKQSILIYGDYDVDGVSAVSIVKLFLEHCDADVKYFIPNRMNDDYGMCVSSLEKCLTQNNYDLVITVDCGITSFKAIDFLNKIGLKTIITDHHLCMDELPNADAIVNPKLDVGSQHEFLCGAATAFKLVWATAQLLSEGSLVGKKFHKILESFIPIVAIATVADVMPLKGDNRLIVAKGITMLNDFDNLSYALQELIISSSLRNSKIITKDISFRIAPRINAAGRMLNADLVIQLLCSKNSDEAHYLTTKLESLNQQRRKICETVAEDVERCLLADPEFDKRSIFIAADSSWHKGVVGVVSSRMAEKYHRPVIILTMDESKTWIGSARSSGNIDIKLALDACSDLLIRYGGHRGAAGLAITNDNLHAFIQRLPRQISLQTSFQDPKKTIVIDGRVQHQDLNLKLAESFLKLQPFGEGNREPLILIEGLKVESKKVVGVNSRHLKLKFLSSTGKLLSGVYFNHGLDLSLLQRGILVDIVCFPTIFNQRGNSNIELNIEDLKIRG